MHVQSSRAILLHRDTSPSQVRVNQIRSYRIFLRVDRLKHSEARATWVKRVAENTCGFCGRSKEDNRLKAADFESLSAVRIAASDKIIAAHHVRTRFGEARAVCLARARRQRRFFLANDPDQRVFRLCPAMRTIQLRCLRFGAFSKEVAFFHATVFSVLRTDFQEVGGRRGAPVDLLD